MDNIKFACGLALWVVGGLVPLALQALWRRAGEPFAEPWLASGFVLVVLLIVGGLVLIAGADPLDDDEDFDDDEE